MFDLACVYSLMGQKDKAVEWLTKTVENPKTILPGVNFADPDLALIKDDARVKSLWETVDRKVHPCKYWRKAGNLGSGSANGTFLIRRAERSAPASSKASRQAAAFWKIGPMGLAAPAKA